MARAIGPGKEKPPGQAAGVHQKRVSPPAPTPKGSRSQTSESAFAGHSESAFALGLLAREFTRTADGFGLLARFLD